jgi:membrane peptidoglycan carboxypeptidase
MAYFNHMPGQLTLRESAFLAAILPNPALFGQQYTEGIISPSRRQKMLNLLSNLHRGGYLSEPTRRYHASLVEQGTISNTPPPRMLGVHMAELEELPPGLHRLGSLFFE